MERNSIGGAAASAQPLGAAPGIGRAVRFLSAALLCLVALSAPDLAYAAHGGGGGGGGGGFHGGGGGFHSGGFGGFHGGAAGGFRAGGLGGFSGGGFSGGGFHPGMSPGAGMDRSHAGEFRGGSVALRGGERAGHWSHGWRNGSYGWWWDYDPYLRSGDGAYDDYSGYGQTYASQSWYYCADPAGYYPYIAQCNTSWQTVPAQ
jgi:hypothetical protein